MTPRRRTPSPEPRVYGEYFEHYGTRRPVPAPARRVSPDYRLPREPIGRLRQPLPFFVARAIAALTGHLVPATPYQWTPGLHLGDIVTCSLSQFERSGGIRSWDPPSAPGEGPADRLTPAQLANRLVIAAKGGCVTADSRSWPAAVRIDDVMFCCLLHTDVQECPRRLYSSHSDRYIPENSYTHNDVAHFAPNIPLPSPPRQFVFL